MGGMYDVYHKASPHTKDSADKAASYCEKVPRARDPARCFKDAYDLYRKDSNYANPENDNKSPTKAASYCEKNSRDRYPARCLKDMYDMYHTASPHTKDSADKAASYCDTDAGASEFSGIIVSQASAFV